MADFPVKSDWQLGDQYTAADANALADAVNALGTEMAAKAALSHTHNASDITGGTFDVARLPLGSSGSSVCVGNDSRLSNTRTPTDNTVTFEKLASNVALALSTPQAPTAGISDTVAVTSPRQRAYVTATSAVTISGPTGNPQNGYQLVYRIKDNGTARALTWNAIFRAIGVVLPTTTVANKTLYVACEYNATDSKWDVLAVGQES